MNDRPIRDRKLMKEQTSRPGADRRPAGDRKPAEGSGWSKRPGGTSARPTGGNRRPEGENGKPAAGWGKRPEGVTVRPAGENRRPMGNHARPAGPGRPANGTPRPVSVHCTQARRVAFDVLQDVSKEGSFAALALDKRLEASKMAPNDKRLCSGIVYSVLENRMAIDYQLDRFLSNPNVEPQIRDILRIGACQILFFDRVPDSAAVNEAVKLTRDIKLDSLSALVNAVLRSLEREKENLSWPDREKDPTGYLSVRYSMPRWIVKRLVADYGFDTAREIISFRPEKYATIIRPNLTRYTDSEFEMLMAKKVWEKEKGIIPHTWRIFGAPEITFDRDYVAGNFTIQGESSVLCGLCAGVRPGQTVVDACAAPGGKSTLMAELMQVTGRVFSWDVHDHRVELIRSYQRRMGLENIRPAARDATVLREDMLGVADVVLVDAPCMGLGVMTEKPDVKYSKAEEDVASVVEIQRKLLDTLSQYVKRGGTLVYSTCSILKDENERQVQAFLASHPEFHKAPLPADVPEQIRAQDGPFGLQLLQHRDEVEGFFIVRLKRS